jgi:DNA processing protein
VAIVGSRAASDYGRIATERIAGDLGAIGLAVISGMALGVDTHAHRGCIEAGGRTVAVLGSGLDVVYPASNRGLMGKILATGGAVISEFQPGTRPLKPNFPRRNRLISGLALGVIVVEAALRSGSLITARFALEQGKEVFAVPGTILSRTSEGANALIRDGAKMATSAEHVVAELAPVLKGFIQSIRRAAPASEEKGDGGSSAGHSGDEGAVAAALGPEPRHVDEITRELGLGAARTVAALLGLELRGVVKQLEGKRFYLARQGR